jgi:hypothetical protein
MLARILPFLLLVGYAVSMKDKATGIAFPPKSQGLDLFGVGVRKKGPIKVYSVAMYGSSDLKEKLSSISRSDGKGKEALEALQSGAKDEPTSFLLEMGMKVGGEKMASAIADSVAPRHSGSSSEVIELKALIFEGVDKKGGTATKGTTLEFSCTSEGIEVSVDGKSVGQVSSSGLAKSFCDVYLDDKAVSPALRSCILENCCAP